MACTPRYLKVRKYVQSTYVEGRTQGYRFRLEVIEAVNIDAEVFVHQKLPAAASGEIPTVFSNVASMVDLEEYPVGYSADNPEVFFRESFCDVVVRTLDQMEESLEDIQEDLTALLNALCDADGFVAEDWEFGSKASSSSSSESSPSSSSTSSTVP